MAAFQENLHPQNGLVLVVLSIYNMLCVHLPPLPSLAVGYSLIAINEKTVSSKVLPDGRSAMEVLADPANYPLSLKFTRLKASINERIMLLSMFHS